MRIICEFQGVRAPENQFVYLIKFPYCSEVIRFNKQIYSFEHQSTNRVQIFATSNWTWNKSPAIPASLLNGTMKGFAPSADYCTQKMRPHFCLRYNCSKAPSTFREITFRAGRFRDESCVRHRQVAQNTVQMSVSTPLE